MTVRKGCEPLIDSKALALTKTIDFGRDIDGEISGEVWLSLLTPRGSVPYYREYGTDLKRQEGRPLTERRRIDLTVQTMEAVAVYNRDLNSDEERRVALLSRDLDFIVSDASRGEASALVRFIPLRKIGINPTGSDLITGATV